MNLTDARAVIEADGHCDCSGDIDRSCHEQVSRLAAVARSLLAKVEAIEALIDEDEHHPVPASIRLGNATYENQKRYEGARNNSEAWRMKLCAALSKGDE